jgi:hypothetical protein
MVDLLQQNAEISKSIQDLLVREYLKKNAGLEESALCFRTRNGKIVLDHVDRLFKNQLTQQRIQKEQKKQQKFLRDIPMNELATDQEERYRACIESAKQSKKLVNILFSCHLQSFSLIHKMDTTNRIRRLERNCGASSRVIVDSKRKFLLLMESETIRPTSSIVQTNVLELLEGTLQLIKNQCSLLNTEADLSNSFLVYSREIIEKHFKDIQSRITPKTIQTIEKYYQYLLSGGKIDLLKTRDVNYEIFQSQMTHFQSLLEKKRGTISKLENVVAFIEKLIEEIKESQEQTPLPEERPTDPVQETKSGGRMATIKNILDKACFWKKR